MGEDIARLGIEINSKDILKAIKRLDKLEKQSKDNVKQNKKLGSSFGLLKGAIAGIAFGVAVRGIISTAAAFEKLEASLITVTGSTEKAVQAMDGIKQFATETPFQVQEITDAFIKLKALGIAPTEENLRSFGNTASAMGKSLNQMIEAVADAATGEFERLKEFGIKSKSEGDKVSFTFQGITTTVGKNADEITKFLEGIGQTQFAGAMEKQMDTLDGAFSNFSDTVDNAISKLSKESGFNALIKAATGGVSLFIRELTGTQSIDDFTTKLNALNAELKEREDKLAEKGFGGFGRSAKAAGIAIKNLKEEIAGLQGQIDSKKEEVASDALTQAGALTTEQIVAKKQEEANALFEIETDQLMLQVELDDQKLTQQLAFNEKRLMADEDYYSRLYNLESGSLKAGATFAKAIRDGEVKSALQNGALMISNLAKTSKTAFGIQKALALATAVAELPSAVISSFKNGGGYPFGLIPAGLMLATGLKQIQSIKSSSFGGGGSPSVSLGGGSTSPSAPVASGLPSGSTALPDASEQPITRVMRVVVEGDGPNSEGMRRFAENLAETIEDMGGVGRLVLS